MSAAEPAPPPDVGPATRAWAFGVALLRRHRFLRFLLVGGVNTAFGYGLFLLALALMPTTLSALVVANILAILFNFVTTGSLVFGVHDPRLILRFFGVYGVVFAYNAIGLGALESLGVRPWVGGLILLPGAVVIGYLLNRTFVFGATR